MALRVVREVRTSELVVGDTVDWHGEPREVVECTDTGQPALMGTGSDYLLTLRKPSGERVPMRSAASDRWTRI